MCWFFKQKTAYEVRISDWSSDVCSSDLARQQPELHRLAIGAERQHFAALTQVRQTDRGDLRRRVLRHLGAAPLQDCTQLRLDRRLGDRIRDRRVEIDLFQIVGQWLVAGEMEAAGREDEQQRKDQRDRKRTRLN